MENNAKAVSPRTSMDLQSKSSSHRRMPKTRTFFTRWFGIRPLPRVQHTYGDQHEDHIFKSKSTEISGHCCYAHRPYRMGLRTDGVSGRTDYALYRPADRADDGLFSGRRLPAYPECRKICGAPRHFCAALLDAVLFL